MNKSDYSYLITAIFFTIGYIGLTFYEFTSMYVLWLGFIAAGILAFIFRIIRGDD